MLQYSCSSEESKHDHEKRRLVQIANTSIASNCMRDTFCFAELIQQAGGRFCKKLEGSGRLWTRSYNGRCCVG